ncbi:hypothetical protein AZ20_0574 [Bordetella bronchiseptica E014]|nr:hypothetical protein L576_0629 [Bordetella bronchiseptica OSU054]KAK65385.1 hypothetical protein L530_0635 [Bordetella bronchiseptica MO211]KAK77606.1 hypothetical protein L507_0591 [Bordetella bronchiseptica CA90 BB02]KCV50171.1 hypothetical protein L492_0648 [Bordetella bronchiseptica 7E71]KDB76909.1 hypothetical protein L494_0615 [Bordetella bronchiseptica CA90 BB1334]KDC16540.1 hypothetical protein AZ20_0574 [Bordetella bronchiseptica E014]KDC22421.1 hypothetical protein L542_0685 [Bor
MDAARSAARLCGHYMPEAQDRKAPGAYGEHN